MKTELQSHLTVCVTGAGAGVDSAWEQRKLEAREMLENAADSPASSARFVRRGLKRVDVELQQQSLLLVLVQALNLDALFFYLLS
jgi:hypothetical protein